MAMIAEVAERQEDIVALCRRYGVRRLEVFGSATTGAFDPLRSDVDFLVEYPDDYDYGLWHERFFALKDDLYFLLGRPVDLVKTNATNNHAFWDSVNASRDTIYDGQAVANVALGYRSLQ